jgi:sugar/nucleoside kinase (ribokinase family)
MAGAFTEFVLCGFVAVVELLFVEAYPSVGGGSFVTRVEETCGADAHIAARILARSGRRTLLFANDVSSGDAGARLRRCAREAGVETHFEARAGGLTPSLWAVCDARGQRTWLVHNPYPEPPFQALLDLSLTPPAIIYADLYSHTWSSLRIALDHWGRNRWLVNLAEGPFAPKLSLLAGVAAPLWLQASAGEDPEADMHVLDQFLSRRPSIRAVFVTMGELGAMCLTAEGRHFVAARRVEVVHTFGAGAVFSSALLTGLADGLPEHQMCRRAVRLAEKYCQGRLLI